MNVSLVTGNFAAIRHLVDYMALVKPDDTYLIGPEDGQELTFNGLQLRAKRLCTRIRQLSLEQGDKVAFLLDNSVSTAVLFLGAMYGGFVAVPLNVRAGVSQLSYMLEHSDAKVVIAGDKYSALIEEMLHTLQRKIQVIFAETDELENFDLDSHIADDLPYLRAEDPALLMYSSGTTGQPKGAIHTHKSILAHGRNSILAHELTSTDRSLLVLPLYHINAECVTLIPTLMCGGSVVIPPRGFVVSEFWNWLDDYRCTWSALVPTIISQLLDWKDPKADSRAPAFERIRFLRSSSAPLSPALHREFLDKFKLPLIQAMGSSEAGNVFSNPVPPGVNKIGSPGLAWGFEAKIVDHAGKELPADEPGEVLLRGDGMMRGYYKDPAGTAAVLDMDGWLHTGDLAYRDEDGYFFVVGRSKELIIKGGMNIAPKQIDEVLESHPAVLEAAAVGVPDRYVGEDVVGFAVLRNGMVCDEGELLKFCESRLGHFKTPTRIYFVGDLPKGPSGKVQRLKLQEEATERSASLRAPTPPVGQSESFVGTIAPSTPIEQLIAETWAQMLKLPQVDLHSNFFSLGGHSLLAIQCLSALRDKLPTRISLADFFENATVADQAALVRTRLGREIAPAAGSSVSWEHEFLQKAGPAPADETIRLRDRSLPCPLSPNQQRIWFMEEATAGEPVYNEAEAVRLRGQLNVELFEKALNVIVERHEILRTTIDIVNEEPTAAVHETWPLQIKQIDLSSLRTTQREAEVERLLIDEPRLPYELKSQPGIRATLLRLGDRDHVFILMMHHLVCDWSSEGVLWRELSALYNAGCRGESRELPPMPIQHGDYAAWQHERLNRREVAEDLSYWEAQLRGAPALLDLPMDRPSRPTTISYRGARRRFEIGPKLTFALRDCSKREAVSVFTVVAAALNALLYRYTGQDDILVGIPLADRDRPEIQSVIGFLLHTHVLRTQFSEDLSFRELLIRVQKATLELYAHRSPPFDRVVSKVQPERNQAYSPLFQVMLNWRDRDQMLSFIGLHGLEVDSLLAESRTAKFDLTMMLTDGAESIDLEIEYSTDLFEETRIERMVGHFTTLLEAAVANPQCTLVQLPLLTPVEREQLLVGWNRTEVSYPRDRCLHQLIEEQVERAPDAVAVAFEGESLTYRQLNERAGQLARRLQGLGVGPDTLVAICVERSLEMVVGLLGILKAGGAYVPLDPSYPRERLDFMLRDSGALLLLTQERFRDQLDRGGLNSKILCMDADPETFTGSNETLTCVAGPENLAYVIYTSGSTGQPKGVEIRHRNLLNILCAMAKELDFAQKDKLLAVTTISFDIAGLELFLPLIAGGQVELAPTSELRDGVALSQRLKRSRATVMQATPTTWAMLIEAGWTGNRSLRALCGGEAATPTLAEELARRAEKVWNVYGPTETTIWSSLDRIQVGHPITIGRPIANTHLYIVDKQFEPVPIGVLGELLIGGDGLARGYFRRQGLTAERFVANPFTTAYAQVYKTGDRVRRLADGTVEWMGRLDQQVKIRGFRIELGEIESALAAHPAVHQATAVAREDVLGEKRLVVYLTLRDGESLNDSELRDLLRAKLPEYMIPSAFVVLDGFPLTPNGKVDRNALPQPDLQSSGAAEFARPETETQVALADIWREILGVQQVGIHDNFFDLGGHSLVLIRLTHKINSFFLINLAAVELFGNQTIAQLAKIIDEQKSRQQRFVFCLRQGQEKTPLYFVSTAINEAQMAKLIGGERPVYGIQIPWPASWHQAAKDNRVSSFPSVEQFASLFVKALHEHLGTGPCILAGHCFAGLLAFEVARQFQKQGGKVESVVVIDRPARPLRVYPTALNNLRQCWSRTPADPGRLTREGFAGRINRSASILRWLLGAEKWRAERALGLWRGELTPTFDSEGVPIRAAVLLRFYRHLHQRYRLQRLDCRGIIIRAAFIDDYESVRWVDEQMGWSGLFSKGIEGIKMSGRHNSFTESSGNILSLASAITESIAMY